MNGLCTMLAFMVTVGSLKTNAMKDETVVFCSDLQARSAWLLFPPEEMLSVARANGTQTFEENVDYTVDSDGLITLTPDSRIPVLDYYAGALDDTFYRFVDPNGTPFYSPGGVYKHEAYDINVTYSYQNHSLDELYDGAWASKLTVASTKLLAKQPLNVTFFGDSITVGAQSSGRVFPHKEGYAKQLTAALKSRFGYDGIHYANQAVGGKTTPWGVQQIQSVIDTAPDLVVLAFGMNDGNGNITAEQYKANTEMMITALRAANPKVSIVLVAEFSPNPDWAMANYGLRAQNRDSLFELYSKYGNIAFVDVGAVSRQIAARKKFQDFSGNNINHPNDFLHWIYTELILHVFPAGGAPAPVAVPEIGAAQVVHNSAATIYGGLEYMAAKGPLGAAGAQYSVIQFPLPDHPVTAATLRLKSYAEPSPSAWGSRTDRAIQVMILSGANTAFSETSATFFSQSAGGVWRNSSDAAAANLFEACDPAVVATSSRYAPGGPWMGRTWYDIGLDPCTVAALEALRLAGRNSVLVYIQIQDDEFSADPSGVRFYSDDSRYPPELVMENPLKKGK